MNALIHTQALGKRYGRRWALTDCDLDIPAGHVVGLVGPNGAGKTTLLNLVTGQLAPSAGHISVLGGEPGHDAAQLARVGYVAQDSPTYAHLSVADHLRLGRHLNPGWDDELARQRVERLGLDMQRKAGRLSGGQRAQLALTLGVAKRPQLLALDEPVAALDPLARREFLQGLMEATVETELSVLLSSHLVSDLERTCDYLVLLDQGKVRMAAPLDEVFGTHHRLTGPRTDASRLPQDMQVISVHHTDRQSTYVVRTGQPIHDPTWSVSDLSLEDVVLAYLTPAPSDPAPALEVLR
ncbi:MAG TPA: ABC transporter ATP-binding protein [Propionibacteriaceae bacterium]|nr:ABC transporter ATP-binding protein [Propionibacteriaceae bacterium]